MQASFQSNAFKSVSAYLDIAFCAGEVDVMEEKEMDSMVKKIVDEILKEIEFDLESLMDGDSEDIESLVFEKVISLLMKDPRHSEAVTTFGNEELEKLELN